MPPPPGATLPTPTRRGTRRRAHGSSRRALPAWGGCWGSGGVLAGDGGCRWAGRIRLTRSQRGDAGARFPESISPFFWASALKRVQQWPEPHCVLEEATSGWQEGEVGAWAGWDGRCRIPAPRWAVDGGLDPSYRRSLTWGSSCQERLCRLEVLHHLGHLLFLPAEETIRGAVRRGRPRAAWGGFGDPLWGPWDPRLGWVEVAGSPDPAMGTRTLPLRSKSSPGEDSCRLPSARIDVLVPEFGPPFSAPCPVSGVTPTVPLRATPRRASVGTSPSPAPTGSRRNSSDSKEER